MKIEACSYVPLYAIYDQCHSRKEHRDAFNQALIESQLTFGSADRSLFLPARIIAALSSDHWENDFQEEVAKVSEVLSGLPDGVYVDLEN
jgi:hypothetical protein